MNIREEELLWYVLGDGLDAARHRQITDALAKNSGLRAQHATLQAQLEVLKTPIPEISPRPEVLARWHAALKSAQLREQRNDKLSLVVQEKPALRWAPWFAGAAVLSALGLWLHLAPPSAPSSAHRQANTNRTPNATQLPHASASGPENRSADRFSAQAAVARFAQSAQSELSALTQLQITTETESLLEHDQIVSALRAQHQMLERLAELRGQQSTARLLRAMEPLLEELAQKSVSDQGEQIIAQLEFEYAVLLTKSKSSTSKNRSL